MPRYTNIAYLSPTQHTRAQPNAASIPIPGGTLVEMQNVPMTAYESPTQHIPNAAHVPRQDTSVEEDPSYAVIHDSSITVNTNAACTSSWNIQTERNVQGVQCNSHQYSNILM